MTGREGLKSMDRIPGPGQYTPRPEAVTDRPRSAVMGKDARMGRKHPPNVPGPGNYQMDSTLRGSKYG